MVNTTQEDEAVNVVSRRQSRWPLQLFVAIALGAIGTSEPFGSLVSSPFLQSLGRLSSASVNPLVFNQVGGLEFWANHYRFEFVSRSGARADVAVTHDLLARIRGPHPRVAAYVVPIGLGPVTGPGFYVGPLRYGLCNEGPLAEDLGLGEALTSILIHIESGSPGDDRVWTLAVNCDS